MPNLKTSDEEAAANVAAIDIFRGVKNGRNVKFSFDQVLEFAVANFPFELPDTDAVQRLLIEKLSEGAVSILDFEGPSDPDKMAQALAAVSARGGGSVVIPSRFNGEEDDYEFDETVFVSGNFNVDIIGIGNPSIRNTSTTGLHTFECGVTGEIRQGRVRFVGLSFLSTAGAGCDIKGIKLPFLEIEHCQSDSNGSSVAPFWLDGIYSPGFRYNTIFNPTGYGLYLTGAAGNNADIRGNHFVMVDSVSAYAIADGNDVINYQGAVTHNDFEFCTNGVGLSKWNQVTVGWNYFETMAGYAARANPGTTNKAIVFIGNGLLDCATYWNDVDTFINEGNDYENAGVVALCATLTNARIGFNKFSGGGTITVDGDTLPATGQWTNAGYYAGANGYSVNGLKIIGARDTGWAAMTGTANKNSVYDVASVTLPQLAGRVKSIQDLLNSTHGLGGT